MKDHEIAALVNRLRDIAIGFHASGQLRERIAHEIAPLLSPAAQSASAPVASIDTPEFCALLGNLDVAGEIPDNEDGYMDARRLLIAHIDAWGHAQRAEGMRHALQTIKASIEPAPARTTADVAYESLTPERRKKFDADMVLLDQRMQVHRRSRERRKLSVPVDVEKRLADRRGAKD